MSEKQLVYIEIEPSNPEVWFKWIVNRIAQDKNAIPIIKSKVEFVDLLLKDPKVFSNSVFLIRWNVEDPKLQDLTFAIRILLEKVPIMVQSIWFSKNSHGLASGTKIYEEWIEDVYSKVEQLLKD